MRVAVVADTRRALVSAPEPGGGAEASEVRDVAFSLPAAWYTRLAGPLGRLLQRRITARYLSAIH